MKKINENKRNNLIEIFISEEVIEIYEKFYSKTVAKRDSILASKDNNFFDVELFFPSIFSPRQSIWIV